VLNAILSYDIAKRSTTNVLKETDLNLSKPLQHYYLIMVLLLHLS